MIYNSNVNLTLGIYNMLNFQVPVSDFQETSKFREIR